MARTLHGHWDEQKPLRRDKRRQPTPAEAALWQRLRNRQLAGAKFRRQHPVDHFIVDFYCAEAALAIEVDGEIHEHTQEADALRQAYLESLGLRFIRFSNGDVISDIDRVLATIARLIPSRPSQ